MRSSDSSRASGEISKVRGPGFDWVQGDETRLSILGVEHLHGFHVVPAPDPQKDVITLFLWGITAILKGAPPQERSEVHVSMPVRDLYRIEVRRSS